MTENEDKLTPMFAQYQSIKKNYPDALLFFRMGDFYELFFEDAVIASRELQLALTSRGKSGASAAPMCGVPWHASQSYLAQLVDKGYNVAICEQIEDPKATKGIVKRAVTSLITPGTVLNEANLNAKTHNYLGAALCGLNNSCAFAWADISTGQWSGLEFHKQADMWQWISKLSPKELLMLDGQRPPAGFNSEGIRLVHQPAVNFELRRATERLLEAQKVCETNALGLENKPTLTRVLGAILAYLEQTYLRKPDQLMPFKPLDLGRRLIIDEITEKNLEIFVRLNGRRGKGTLRYVIDYTLTPMGGRFLEDMLHHPWRDLKPIKLIQEKVRFLFEHDDCRVSLRKALEQVYDLERLIMRIYLNKASIRDFLALRQSLCSLPSLSAAFNKTTMPDNFAKLFAAMDMLEDCAKLLDQALVDSLEDVSGDNGMFRIGYNAALDQQLELLSHGENKLQALLEAEREKTGILKIKLGNNKVFGYYFEVLRSSIKNDIPAHFIRRQSLANAERYTTEELKKLEEDLLLASDRRDALEKEMFENLRAHLAAQKERILQTADIIAQLDYWQSLAEAGRHENWAMPDVNDNNEIHIQGGRHPVVENMIGHANFVANDFHFDQKNRLCLLTGPNMAGKSTILRQVALICVLAQIGSMVPATSANIGLVDRLFSRVGASDNIAQGQSTFMVEMIETARILRQATRRSLIILDEIGRGTSTYDGMALAWAVVEDLASRCQGQLRVIFATHYHELTSLEGQINGLFTMNIAVGAYDSNEIIFLHRLLPGPSDKSYGIEVARLAGIPYPVVQRARDILKNLEQNKVRQTQNNLQLPGIEKSQSSAALLLKELKETNRETMTPESAFDLINKWYLKWGDK